MRSRHAYGMEERLALREPSTPAREKPGQAGVKATAQVRTESFIRMNKQHIVLGITVKDTLVRSCSGC